MSVGWSEGATAVHEIRSDEPLGVLVKDVPTGEKVTSTVQNGKAIPSAGDVIAQFLSVLVTRGVAAAEAPPPRPKIFPRGCDPRKMRVDDGADPVAPYGTRAVIVAHPSDAFESTLVLCAGGDCAAAAKKDDATVRNKVALDVLPRRRVVLLAELGLTVPFDPFSTPRFEAIGGTSGPDQLFQLRRTYDFRQSITTSILLGVQWQRSVAALGPTLWIGTGGAVFTQWNLRIGHLLTKGLFFTTGPSMRIVTEALDFSPGDVVAVQRPTGGGNPAAPTIRGKDHLALGWSGGLSLDLATLTDAGQALLKSLGIK